MAGGKVMKIVNAENIVLGRLASYAAKQALLGEDIVIVHCEKAILSGAKDDILAKYKNRREKGEPFHGPFFPRTCTGIVKRTIRGMLPYHQEKGRKAFKKIKVYESVPTEFEGQKFEHLAKADVSKLSTMKIMSIKRLSMLLGAKNE